LREALVTMPAYDTAGNSESLWFMTYRSGGFDSTAEMPPTAGRTWCDARTARKCQTP